MAQVNAADSNVDYSKYFKAENKEETAFQKQMMKDMGILLPVRKETILEDRNNNGVADKGDKPLRQYTTYELHHKVLSKHPEIVAYLKSHGYAVYDIERNSENKPTKFLFVKADQKVALQKDHKGVEKTEEKTRYAQVKPNKPADEGVTANGSGVHGGHPVNKHMKKQPVVAKKEEKVDPKPDSKRKVGSSQPVKIDDDGTIKVGDYTTVGRTAPELKPVTGSEFKSLTKSEKIPANDMGIERALVYRPNNDPNFGLAWGDRHNDNRVNDVVQYGGKHGYKVYEFTIDSERVYLFVK